MRWIFRILWVVFCLGAFEWGSARWLAKNGDSLDKTRSVVWADSFLGWRQRPGLLSEFMGQEIRTNEAGWRAPALSSLKGSPRILLLGPSSAFGWGVAADKTYAAELERQLRQANPANPPQVINAGEIGYSTFQGRRLMDTPEVMGLHPNVILVAYGVNDVDRHRFYFQSEKPDARELKEEKSPLEVQGFRLLSRSFFLNFTYKLIRLARSEGVVSRLETGKSPVPGVRVGQRDFEENLIAIVAKGRDLGARVVFLGTPVNLPPVKSPPSSVQAAFEDGLRHLDAGRLEEASAAIELATRLDPDFNEAYYYLAAIAGSLNRKAESRSFLALAKRSEPLRIHRDVLVYNGLMKRVAGKLGVPFVELDSLFPPGARTGFFVDAVHPSEAGHLVIANEIHRAVFLEHR